MKYIWVIYEKEIKEDGYIVESLIGSYDSEEEARLIYNEILLEKPEDVNTEIVIEKKEKTKALNDLLFNLFFLESQMDKLSTLLNTQASIIKNLNERITKLEKVSN